MISVIICQYLLYICKYKDVQRTQSPKFRLIRKTSDSCIAALKDDLLTSNWDNVTNEEDVNMAYNHFIEKFQTSYCQETAKAGTGERTIVNGFSQHLFSSPKDNLLHPNRRDRGNYRPTR